MSNITSVGLIRYSGSLNRAYELEKLINDAGVVVYEGATHYAYLERLGSLISVLDSFFKVVR